MGRGRAFLVGLLWAMTLVLAATLGWWAARTASEPPSVASTTAEPLTVEAREGTLGERMPYGVSAAWPTTVQVRSGATGTVTSLEIEPGATVQPGDVVLTVDLRPVVVAEGEVPAFRPMQEGDAGADVAQLRRFLIEQGLLTEEGDLFDVATVEAVRRWQSEVGVEATGRVEHGDLVFVRRLPSPVVPAEGMEVGASVSPGNVLLALPDGPPALSLTVSTEHVDRVSQGTEVIVMLSDAPRSLRVERVDRVPDTGQALALLSRPGGVPVCEGDECRSIVDVGGQQVLPAEVVVVPEASGAVIPAAAVYSAVDGSSRVRLASGDEVTVDVLASVDGQAVVSGLDPGARVRLTMQDQAPDG